VGGEWGVRVETELWEKGGVNKAEEVLSLKRENSSRRLSECKVERLA